MAVPRPRDSGAIRRKPADAAAHPAIYTTTLSYQMHTQHTDTIWPHAVTIKLHAFITYFHTFFDCLAYLNLKLFHFIFSKNVVCKSVFIF